MWNTSVIRHAPCSRADTAISSTESRRPSFFRTPGVKS